MNPMSHRVSAEQARYDARRINALWLVVVIGLIMAAGLMAFGSGGGNPRTGAQANAASNHSVAPD